MDDHSVCFLLDLLERLGTHQGLAHFNDLELVSGILIKKERRRRRMRKTITRYFPFPRERGGLILPPGEGMAEAVQEHFQFSAGVPYVLECLRELTTGRVIRRRGNTLFTRGVEIRNGPETVFVALPHCNGMFDSFALLVEAEEIYRRCFEREAASV